MTVMCQNTIITFSTLIIVLCFPLRLGIASHTCSKYYTGSNGTVEIKTNEFANDNSCKWIISPPHNTITTVRILESRSDGCNEPSSCCWIISGQHKICKQNLRITTALSFRKYPIIIQQNSSFTMDLKLEYNTRSLLECPLDDFQCSDKSNCFKVKDICSSRRLCDDYSEKLGCGKCHSKSTMCGNYSDYCFELPERCDGILNCPKGEDEMNCFENCKGVKCPREPKCLNQNQICDDIVDCRSGFDENNCVNFGNTNAFNIILTFLVCTICTILFICLVYRWMTTRRDLNRVLQNLPEFPLAPFQGPGDQDEDSINSSEILDADILPGGEIYESYMANIKKKTVSTKSVQACENKYAHLDTDNELVALASLGVPTELCVGLTVSQDSINSLIKYVNGERPKSAAGNSKQESKTKIVYRENLDVINEKRGKKRTINSAPVSSGISTNLSKITSSITVVPGHSRQVSSSPDIHSTKQTRKLSHSDSLLLKSDEQNVQAKQIFVSARNDSISDSNQWIDIEEFSIQDQISKYKYERDNYEQRKRKNVKRRIGFSYKTTKL